MAADPQMEGEKLVCSKIGQKVRQKAQNCALFAPKMKQVLFFNYFLYFFIFFLSQDFFFSEIFLFYFFVFFYFPGTFPEHPLTLF